MGPVQHPIRILLADDHPSTRAGLRVILESEGFEVCAEVGDAGAAVQAAMDTHPDICVLDVHMPGHGIAAAEKITTKLPETQVVMLTVSRDDEDLFGALRAGAVGYLLKDSDIDGLHLALRGVLDGEAAIPRELVSHIVEEFRNKSHRRTTLAHHGSARLTSREQEVLRFLQEGYGTSGIAEQLFISQATVRSHVASILKKFGVDSRREALDLVD
jgi:two-component system NarL family response regulator